MMVSWPKGATNQGTAAENVRPYGVPVVSMRRSACPRRSTPVTCSESVKMPVAPAKQRS